MKETLNLKSKNAQTEKADTVNRSAVISECRTDQLKRQGKALHIRTIAQIGVLGAMATVLMVFEFPLPFAPPFYKLDFSEIPVLMAGFALGPVAGVLVELIKVLLHMLFQGTTTAGVGDLANFIIGCGLVVPASIIYKIGKTRGHALLGMTAGTVNMTVIGGLMNAYVLLPVYATAFHMPMDSLVSMGTAINPSITSIATLVLFATTPFNALKGVLVSLVVFLLYKKISPILHGKKFA